MSTILGKYIDEFGNGRSLGPHDAELFLDAMIRETDESILSELFNRWNAKDITEDEIFSIAKIMRERCIRVRPSYAAFVDIVGTGGSKAKTFNVSTAAAFVAAGAGLPVAKHGNKAATSNSGSADVLSALGIEPAVNSATAERCLNEIGICFMFAPNFHRLSPTLAKVRRGLGFPTIFNCIGPLCNPAGAPHQLIGVWDKDLVPKMANALARLGTKKSWVVHGEDGLDEISLRAATIVAEVENGAVRTFQVSPRDFGIDMGSPTEFQVRGADESAKIIRGVLNGEMKETAAENLVSLNAMAALYIAGHSKGIREASGPVLDSIRNGHALKKLNALAEAVKE